MKQLGWKYLFLVIISISLLRCTPIKNMEAINHKRNIEYPDRNTSEKMSSSEVSEDIDYLLKTIDDVHPHPYQITNKKDFQNAAYNCKPDTGSISIKDFYLRLAPVVISLGGDHLYISLPWHAFNNYKANGGEVFPIDVDVSDSKLIVSGNLTSLGEIKPGDEIQSINGIKSEMIINELLRYCHGSTGYSKVYKRLTDPYYFSHLLWLVYNFPDKYSVKINGEIFDIDGLSQNKIDKVRRLKYKNQLISEEFKYKKIERGTGFLLVNNFWQDKFNEKLKKAFVAIKDDSIQNLIIDVRYNTGGNTMEVEQLINYLYEKPYKTASFIEQRRSLQEDAMFSEIFAWWFKPLARIIPPLSKYYKTPIGENAKVAMEEKKPKRNRYRFKGNVYVLSGPVNYSSGTEFLSVIKDYKIGTIIGQATGGPANGDGNAYEFSLPNSHLRVTCATNYSIRPSGELTTGGIKPDIEIFISSNERNETDIVLKKTLEIIEGKSK